MKRTIVVPVASTPVVPAPVVFARVVFAPVVFAVTLVHLVVATAVAAAASGAVPGAVPGAESGAKTVAVSGVAAAQAPPSPAGPPSTGASAVLAPAGEPGDRLVVEGRVLAGPGSAPVAGAELVLYQTDRTGCYSAGCADERNAGARNARPRGRLRTDAQGRYEFRTIKPGQYPRSGPPAHIHYELTIGQQPMRGFEIVFEGDSRLTPGIREQAARHDFYILCVPATDADGTLRCRGADVIVQ